MNTDHYNLSIIISVNEEVLESNYEKRLDLCIKTSHGTGFILLDDYVFVMNTQTMNTFNINMNHETHHEFHRKTKQHISLHSHGAFYLKTQRY